VLVVQVPATVPVIITPPSAATSSVGAPASFSVVADGAPPLSYVWRREGTLIAKASQSTLVLGSVQVADAGDYTVTVSNALGSVTSSPARLTVLVPSLPPFIVVQPVSVTATAGGTASFGVTVRGTAPLSYQWRKDGEWLAGATQATLTLTNVRATDAAAYSVAITNAFGTAVSASARLTVNPVPTPPQIETPPTDRTVTEGATVSLSVTASGVGPLSYRWLKGGVPIVGATSATLTFSPVRLTDAGSYTVEVSNAAGTAVSTAAVVRVEPRPSSRITNVSIRTPLAVGQTLIVGLSMSGGAKAVLVRAVGPGLSPFGVSDAMTDPRLMLFRGAVVEGMSDDWGGGPTLAATFASVGAFALPAGSRDAALVATIDGGRTVQVVGASPGTVLVEAYDAGAGDSPRLVNVSARNRVNGSSEPLIAGFTVVGNAPRTILIRGVGPTLASFGVLGALSDPSLELYSGATKINENDTWATSLSTTFGAVGAFALIPGGRDAALLVTLAPGGYTVQVSGVGGATGDALIELYEVISP
ncbi:MAG: immunoglobulin domain-containing protein, partial [Opitutaceae bacterium]